MVTTTVGLARVTPERLPERLDIIEAEPRPGDHAEPHPLAPEALGAELVHAVRPGDLRRSERRRGAGRGVVHDRRLGRERARRGGEIGGEHSGDALRDERRHGEPAERAIDLDVGVAHLRVLPREEVERGLEGLIPLLHRAGELEEQPVRRHAGHGHPGRRHPQRDDAHVVRGGRVRRQERRGSRYARKLALVGL